MRDNVSFLGTVTTGLASLPVNKVNITGASQSLAGYDGATLYIPSGTWTDGTHTFTVQESADNATWTTVAATDLVTWQSTSATNNYPLKALDANGYNSGRVQPAAISSAATAVNQRIGYLGNQPYVRATVTVTGSPVTGAQYDLLWILGNSLVMPANV